MTYFIISEYGVIPSAVSWIYKTIKEQKSKTGARFSVRVSAVAVDSTGTLLSDLLADFAHGQGMQLGGFNILMVFWLILGQRKTSLVVFL